MATYAGIEARVRAILLRGTTLDALLQRVHIEERVALGGDAGRDHVVQHPLDDIGVLLLAGLQQQPLGQVHGGDAGAGLAAGHVRRQLEVFAEGLIHVA